MSSRNSCGGHSYEEDCNDGVGSMDPATHSDLQADGSLTSTRPARGAVLLLCGLPAAGKSTLGATLLKEGATQLRFHLPFESPRKLRIIYISFDLVLVRLQEQRETASFDPQLWHESREAILTAVRSHFEVTGRGDDGTRLGLLELASTSEAESLNERESEGAARDGYDVVVLDDNMHYRSMRRAYYRLARDLQLAFVTLCLPIDLQEALRRNAQRDAPQRVPASTIEHMHQVLQWPDEQHHPWERGACTVDNGQINWAFLARSLPYAVAAASQADVAASKADAAAATAASKQHALDLRLRQITAVHLQSECAQQLPPPLRASLAKQLSVRKKQIFADAKRQQHRAAVAACGVGNHEGNYVDNDADADSAVDELDAAFAATLSKLAREENTPS